MFKFKREHFEKCVDHPLFQEGHKLVFIRKILRGNVVTGQDETLKDLFKDKGFESGSRAWRNAMYDLYKDYPLCILFQKNIDADEMKIRRKLIRAAKDKCEPSWYMLHYHQHYVNFFIIYPMLRILFPDIEIFFGKGLEKTISNVREIVDENLSGKLNDCHECQWFISNSSYVPKSTKYTDDVTNPCYFDLSYQILGTESLFAFNPVFRSEKDFIAETLALLKIENDPDYEQIKEFCTKLFLMKTCNQ